MAATTCDFDRAIRAGNDLELSFGQILPGLDDSTLKTNYGHHMLRQATKNILYMAVQSDSNGVASFDPYPVQLALYAACLVPIVLFAWYLVRRHRKLKLWKEQAETAA